MPMLAEQTAFAVKLREYSVELGDDYRARGSSARDVDFEAL